MEAGENKWCCFDGCYFHPPARNKEEACLEEYQAYRDVGKKKDWYRCGLKKGHPGTHSWRGDLPGGPVKDG